VALIVKVTGRVQGVGFRPFVYNIATELRLKGFVRNLGGEVEITVDGPEQSLNEFLRRLRKEAPVLAVIDEVNVERDAAAGEQEFAEFVILHSRHAESEFQTVPPDTATCELCLAEVADSSNRRFNYPFTNCHSCGPRFTIIKELPYDRRSTSMGEFKMCAQCRDEYDEPNNRRFHAQPNACWKCGPQIWLAKDDPERPAKHRTAQEQLADFDKFVALIEAGGIVALKGLGGFHIICDATNDQAVLNLRARKKRNDKPFAVMFQNLEHARAFATIDDDTAVLLCGPRRPIVLVAPGENNVSEHVAPHLNQLGVMLPYTALHQMLLEKCTNPLVMTSGNFSDEPICMDNADALKRLSTIADAFLLNDRNIESRFDDSVFRRDRGETTLIRRSRGYAPDPLPLHGRVEGCVLAVGAELKNTFCFAKDKHVFLSQHIGDLDDVSAYDFFVQALQTYGALFSLEADVVVHDSHPDYLSTRVAREIAERKGLPIYAVQHHHAHIASCMVDNAITEKVIGVALDGTGYGDDGTIWGGEILIADYHGYERFGHLAPVQMPGMEAAVRQPGRMLAAYATQIESKIIDKRLHEIFHANQLDVIKQQLAQNLNSTVTTSCDRLFDAVAALLDVCSHPTFEGQPAMQLEAVAKPGPSKVSLPERSDTTIDGFAIIRALADRLEHGDDASHLAFTFHELLAQEIARLCKIAAADHHIDVVCLSGGVMQNSLLVSLLSERLSAVGLKVFKQHQVPPNDGGIALGQSIVGAALSGRWKPAGDLADVLN
jgi:hydrogenase maturation protein HypF